MKIRATIETEDGPKTIELSGRLGWTLAHLIDAGPRGITPLEAPALRWSSYVHKLRERGVPIETELEEHGGAYCGRHARYRMTCTATAEEVAP